LDVKRTYLELRPALRRVYLAVSDLAPFLGAADKLGFVPLPAATPLPTAVLDFGPGSVDAWLSRILRAELGIEAAVKLDLERHSLLVEGFEVVLTARELEVAALLNQAEGSIVNREALLEEAWNGGEAVGSNVVEVVIRSLRRKLGDHADCIETVRGAGYRWTATE
jgi:DNA-binding response OmpR family regulator